MPTKLMRNNLYNYVAQLALVWGIEAIRSAVAALANNENFWTSLQRSTTADDVRAAVVAAAEQGGKPRMIELRAPQPETEDMEEAAAQAIAQGYTDDLQVLRYLLVHDRIDGAWRLQQPEDLNRPEPGVRTEISGSVLLIMLDEGIEPRPRA